MSSREQWWTCPSCGLPNIAARHICKRCRFQRDGVVPGVVLPSPSAYTEQTGTLYMAPTRQHTLFLTVQAIEYTGPERTIRSGWDNLVDVRSDGREDYLWLRYPAMVKLTRTNAPHDSWLVHTIPLRCFGYPYHRQLAADLVRFAPQLSARLVRPR